MSYNEYRPTRSDYEFYKFISSRDDLKGANFRLAKTKDKDQDYYFVFVDKNPIKAIHAYTVLPTKESEPAFSQQYSVSHIGLIEIKLHTSRAEIEYFDIESTENQCKGIGTALMNCAKTYIAHNGKSFIDLVEMPHGLILDRDTHEYTDDYDRHLEILDIMYEKMGFEIDPAFHNDSDSYRYRMCHLDRSGTIAANPEYDRSFFNLSTQDPTGGQ